MPVYEFKCSGCSKPFQTYTQTMSWKNVRCPKCGSLKVEKLLSRFAVGHGDGDTDFGGEPNLDAGDMSGAECSGDPSNCQRCDLD